MEKSSSNGGTYTTYIHILKEHLGVEIKWPKQKWVKSRRRKKTNNKLFIDENKYMVLFLWGIYHTRNYHYYYYYFAFISFQWISVWTIVMNSRKKVFPSKIWMKEVNISQNICPQATFDVISVLCVNNMMGIKIVEKITDLFIHLCRRLKIHFPLKKYYIRKKTIECFSSVRLYM